MYLFIFFWSAALKSARTNSGSNEELPFGLIFSSFMCAMMTGSGVFTLLNVARSPQSTANMLITVASIMVGCLSLAAVIQQEAALFWIFCVIEGCVGAYLPAIASLKSDFVEDGIRGRVYSILRFPLNVYVVAAHSLDEEGKSPPTNVVLSRFADDF